jgi:histone H3/H4
MTIINKKQNQMSDTITDIPAETTKTAEEQTAEIEALNKAILENATPRRKKRVVKHEASTEGKIQKPKKAKSKAKRQVAPISCGHKLYREAISRLYENGEIPSKFKLSHEAKVALDEKLADYSIHVYNEAASLGRLNGRKTVSANDFYTVLAFE